MEGLEDHLRVAAREEAVAEALQLLAQFLVIVDAAVEDEVEAEFRVHHRLGGTVRQIDDLEPLVAKADPAAHQLSARIRPAPGLAAHHRRNRARIRDAAIETDFARYAAHGALACVTDLVNIAPEE
jgi:hypothetical protein